MKINSVIKALALAALTAVIAGCSTSRQVSYLLDLEYGVSDTARTAPELRLQKEDMLDIKVFCDNPELTRQFQLTSADGAERQYEVDSLGFIDFPVIGMVRAESLTAKELAADLEARIKATGYIKDPVVEARLANFQVTVLGAIGNKNITLADNKVNLFELLAMTGSPGADCDLRDVMVIRTENGLRTPYQVNLQTKDIYNSPVFYLRQNDVVYFKPKGIRITPTGDALMKIASPGLTIASIITNFLLWSRRY